MTNNDALRALLDKWNSDYLNADANHGLKYRAAIQAQLGTCMSELEAALATVEAEPSRCGRWTPGSPYKCLVNDIDGSCTGHGGKFQPASEGSE